MQERVRHVVVGAAHVRWLRDRLPSTRRRRVAGLVQHRGDHRPARTQPHAIARLLRSLSSDVPHRLDNAEDVYLAAPWSRPSPLVRETFDALRRTGWRLVGDGPNSKHLGEKRIDTIQRTTRGVVAVMPHDPSQPDTATSPYILQEARIALDLGEPLLLLAEPGVVPPRDLVWRAFRGMSSTMSTARRSRRRWPPYSTTLKTYCSMSPTTTPALYLLRSVTAR